MEAKFDKLLIAFLRISSIFDDSLKIAYDACFDSRTKLLELYNGD